MPKWALAYLALTLVALAIGFEKAMTAPTEATMGNLYRVFFYHLPHAIISFVFPYLNCVASFAYLYWRNRDADRAAAADAFALASAEMTVLYASIGLATGSLWGRAAWGIWWAWDARLTTTLLLWLIYVSYLLTRRFAAGPQMRTSSAVLGIFGGIGVPIVYVANRIPGQHPGPVFGGDRASGMDPVILRPFLWNIAAWMCWGILVLILRHQFELKQQAIAAHEAEQSLNA